MAISRSWTAARQHWLFGPGLVAVITLTTLLPFLDPLGSYPGLPEGPGLTIDESFNVQQGVYLIEAAKLKGLFLLDPPNLQEVFGKESVYLPDHPPLGRVWLGVHHHFTSWLFPPHKPSGMVTIACARTGSMTAFALTILLVGGYAAKWYGPTVGTLAAIALALMPRMYGHAQIASLETITNLTWTAAAVVFADCWFRKEKPSGKAAAWTGLVFGVALLTKIQAILLFPTIVIWAFLVWRTSAVKLLSLWGGIAFAVFLLGWPWLWLDPAANLTEYFARTTARATLEVWYFGVKYADKIAPASYSFVIFLLVVPTVPQLLGFFGVLRAWWKPVNAPAEQSPPFQWTSRESFLLTAIIVPLTVFAVPKIAVYNGERLFSVVFPLWAIFIGLGADALRLRLRGWFNERVGMIVVTMGFITAGAELISLRPCELCFYNGFIGYLPGAARAGMELDYWGCGLTRSLIATGLKEARPGDRVEVSPVYHQFQMNDLLSQSPFLRERNLQLVEGPADDHVPPVGVRFTIRFHTHATGHDAARHAGRTHHPQATFSRWGVPLAIVEEWEQSKPE